MRCAIACARLHTPLEFLRVLSIACEVPHFKLLFFFSFVSLISCLFSFELILNFFCVGYIDGIPRGILTLYFFSIRPGFHNSIIPLLFMVCLRSLSPLFSYFLEHVSLGHSVLIKTIMWVFPLLHISPFSYPLLRLFLKLRYLNDSVFG